MFYSLMRTKWNFMAIIPKDVFDTHKNKHSKSPNGAAWKRQHHTLGVFFFS